MITRPARMRVPRPADGRAGDRRARGPRPAAWRLAACLVAATAVPAACAQGPVPVPAETVPPGSPAPSMPQGSPSATASAGAAVGPALLLLADTDEGRALSLLPASGELVPLPLPDPRTVGVAPLGDGSLVALAADGQAFAAPGGVAGLLAGDGWRPLILTAGGALPAGAQVAFGVSVAPDGATLAAVARPPTTETPGSLVLVEPGRGRREILLLQGQVVGTPPAWVDGARTAILGRDRRDRTELLVVAAASGTITSRHSLRALDVRTSGDTRTVVVLGDEDRLFVGATAALLETGEAPAGGPVVAAGDAVRGGLALDETGRRLAVVVEPSDGGRVQIAVYELGPDGWREARRITPPAGTGGGMLAWLP